MADLIEGMFFDLDGTLCQTGDANFEAYSLALGDVGVSVSRQAFDAFDGVPSNVFLRHLAPGLTDDQIRAVMAAKTHHYAQTISMVKPNSSLINFLHLVRSDHTIALVTSARRVNALRVLEHAKLLGVFDHMVFGDDVRHGKPDPEAYLLALEMTGLKPAQTVAFEDSLAGIASACAAGLRVIRVGADAA